MTDYKLIAVLAALETGILFRLSGELQASHDQSTRVGSKYNIKKVYCARMLSCTDKSPCSIQRRSWVEVMNIVFEYCKVWVGACPRGVTAD